MTVWVLRILIVVLLSGMCSMVSPVYANGDLFEVAQIAEQAEGSGRTWAYRTFIVICLIVAITALATHHVGVFMAAMGLVFLGAFLGKGPDAISDAVGLAEGATLPPISISLEVSAPISLPDEE